MTKEELRKKFVSWLDGDFDKEGDGLPSRWILCVDGGIGDRDCDCVRDNNIGIENDGCNCSCHRRITEIIDFFWKELNGEIK
jgi:hypothetical protein